MTWYRDHVTIDKESRSHDLHVTVTWPWYYIKAYIKGCNICLASKTVKYKPYSDLQALPILIYQWKDFLIDFITGLLVSTNWKSENCNFILIIINRLTKIIYYKPVKININDSGLAKVTLNMIVWHYSLFNSIVSNKDLLFIFKFWLLFCYFFGIKQKFFTVFYS